jgi:iron complex transport system ATP-binding protein
MLDVENLSFEYMRGAAVLDGVTFKAEEGELLAVLGANGAGKSTLFHCILGFQRRFGGDIRIAGESVRRINTRSLAKRIAFVPQSHAPTFNYTVFDMVLMGTSAQIGSLVSPGKTQTENARRAIEILSIEHLAERGFTHISGGEQQLALIARAIAQQAKTLIMDEPTANLDFGNQIRVMTRIKELSKQGFTIVMSTHNPDHAKWFADRVVALENGGIAADGAPENILTEDLICRLYHLQINDLRRFYP